MLAPSTLDAISVTEPLRVQSEQREAKEVGFGPDNLRRFDDRLFERLCEQRPKWSAAVLKMLL